nr:MAG TPA: hypothetical protein [Caudoviricetes sp.]
MMKSGTSFEPAYRLMAECKTREDECERLGMTYQAGYWHVKLVGVQSALKALTDEWPNVLHHDASIMIEHGTYKQMFTV